MEKSFENIPNREENIEKESEGQIKEDYHDMDRARELLGQEYNGMQIADIFSYLKPEQTGKMMDELEGRLGAVINEKEKNKIRQEWIDKSLNDASGTTKIEKSEQEKINYKEEFKGTYKFFEKFKAQYGRQMEKNKGNGNNRELEKDYRENNEILSSLEKGDASAARERIDSMMEQNFQNIKKNLSNPEIVKKSIDTLTQLLIYRRELDKAEKLAEMAKEEKPEEKGVEAEAVTQEAPEKVEKEEWIGNKPGGARGKARLEAIEREAKEKEAELEKVRAEAEKSYQPKAKEEAGKFQKVVEEGDLLKRMEKEGQIAKNYEAPAEKTEEAPEIGKTWKVVEEGDLLERMEKEGQISKGWEVKKEAGETTIDIEGEIERRFKEKEDQWAREINLMRAEGGEKISESQAHSELAKKFLGELGYSVEYRGLFRGKSRLVKNERGENESKYVIGEGKKTKKGIEQKPVEFKTYFNPDKHPEFMNFLKDKLKEKIKAELEGEILQNPEQTPVQEERTDAVEAEKKSEEKPEEKSGEKSAKEIKKENKEKQKYLKDNLKREAQEREKEIEVLIKRGKEYAKKEKKKFSKDNENNIKEDYYKEKISMFRISEFEPEAKGRLSRNEWLKLLEKEIIKNDEEKLMSDWESRQEKGGEAEA